MWARPPAAATCLSAPSWLAHSQTLARYMCGWLAVALTLPRFQLKQYLPRPVSAMNCAVSVRAPFSVSSGQAVINIVTTSFDEGVVRVVTNSFGLSVYFLPGPLLPPGEVSIVTWLQTAPPPSVATRRVSPAGRLETV